MLAQVCSIREWEFCTSIQDAQNSTQNTEHLPTKCSCFQTTRLFFPVVNCIRFHSAILNQYQKAFCLSMINHTIFELNAVAE